MNPQATEKRCPSCEEIKPLSEFYLRKNNNHTSTVYYIPECKTCSRARNSIYRKTDAGKLAYARGSRKWSKTEKGKSSSKRRLKKYRESEHGQEMARRLENTEKVKAMRRKWKHSERGRLSSIDNQHRRRQVLGACDYKLTPSDWEAIKMTFNGRCAYCGNLTPNPTVDHIIPLSRGGTHSYENIAPACEFCNYSKGNKLISEWKTRKLKVSDMKGEYFAFIFGRTYKTSWQTDD